MPSPSRAPSRVSSSPSPRLHTRKCRSCRRFKRPPAYPIHSRARSSRRRSSRAPRGPRTSAQREETFLHRRASIAARLHRRARDARPNRIETSGNVGAAERPSRRGAKSRALSRLARRRVPRDAKNRAPQIIPFGSRARRTSVSIARGVVAPFARAVAPPRATAPRASSPSPSPFASTPRASLAARRVPVSARSIERASAPAGSMRAATDAAKRRREVRRPRHRPTPIRTRAAGASSYSSADSPMCSKSADAARAAARFDWLRISRYFRWRAGTRSVDRGTTRDGRARVVTRSRAVYASTVRM